MANVLQIQSKSWAAIAVGTIGLIATAGSANAFTVKGDVDARTFWELSDPNSGNTPEFAIPWAAESRIGTPDDAEKEINIHDESNSSSGTRVDKHFDWVNGESVDFSLIFDQVNKTLTYVVGGTSVEVTNIVEENFSDLYIRTSARKPDTSVIVDNLFLTDSTMSSGITGSSSAACSGGSGCGFFDADYFHISDIEGSFTLTGTSTMSWGAERPARSNLAYQIKLVEGGGEDPTAVPAPAGLPFLSVGFAALRRKFKNNEV